MHFVDYYKISSASVLVKHEYHISLTTLHCILQIYERLRDHMTD